MPLVRSEQEAVEVVRGWTLPAVERSEAQTR